MRSESRCCGCSYCACCETRCRAWAVNTCGGLTKPQRVLFAVLVVSAVAVNAFFLQYAVTRAVKARDEPVTKLSRIGIGSGAAAFPDWVVSLNALTFNDTTCVFAHVQCVLWNETNSPVPAPGLRCVNETVGDATAPSRLHVHVPGALWRPGVWLPLEVTLSSSDCSVFGSVLSASDLASQSRAHLWASVFTISPGWASWVALSASSEATLQYPEPQYHVTGTPKGQMCERLQPQTAKVWFTAGYLTNPFIDTSYESVSYTWQDAVAAQFAVLNVTVGFIVFLFPMTATAKHQRMFVFDRPTVAGAGGSAGAAAGAATAASTVTSANPMHASTGSAATDGSRPLLASSSLMRSQASETDL